jgi:flagellar biosynthetic protein FliR
LPAVDPTSWAGLLILVQEMLIGAAMGFAMRLVFAAIEFAGEVASSTMGFGFATFFDPTTRPLLGHQPVPGAGRDHGLPGHERPPGAAAGAGRKLLSRCRSRPPRCRWRPRSKWCAGAGSIFSAGLQIALPIIAAMLVTNVALAILTRAAPQLNMFGIGFPITLGAGLLVISLTLPYLNTPMQNLFNQGIEASRRIPRTGGQKPAQPATAPLPAAS